MASSRTKGVSPHRCARVRLPSIDLMSSSSTSWMERALLLLRLLSSMAHHRRRGGGMYPPPPPTALPRTDLRALCVCRRTSWIARRVFIRDSILAGVASASVGRRGPAHRAVDRDEAGRSKTRKKGRPLLPVCLLLSRAQSSKTKLTTARTPGRARHTHQRSAPGRGRPATIARSWGRERPPSDMSTDLALGVVGQLPWPRLGPARVGTTGRRPKASESAIYPSAGRGCSVLRAAAGVVVVCPRRRPLARLRSLTRRCIR